MRPRRAVAGWLFEEWPRENEEAGVHTADDLAAQLRRDNEPTAAGAPSLSLPLTLIAVEQGKNGCRPIGTVRLDKRDLPALGGAADAALAPWLAALFVPADQRGRGIGRILVDAALEAALIVPLDEELCGRAGARRRSRFAHQVHLWFPESKSSRLRPLYERCGFEPAGRTSFSESSFGADVCVMRRQMACPRHELEEKSSAAPRPNTRPCHGRGRAVVLAFACGAVARMLYRY